MKGVFLFSFSKAMAFNDKLLGVTDVERPFVDIITSIILESWDIA